MSHQPLPLAWVDKLFARFSATFGAQKVGAMFPRETHDEVRQLWSEQLGRFEPETLRCAVQAMIDSRLDWPPTLSEFVGMCQRAAIERRQHANVVMLPLPRANPEVVEREVQAAAAVLTNRKPDRRWAERLIARHEAGEKLPLAVLSMARAALEAAPVPRVVA